MSHGENQQKLIYVSPRHLSNNEGNGSESELKSLQFKVKYSYVMFSDNFVLTDDFL